MARGEGPRGSETSLGRAFAGLRGFAATVPAEAHERGTARGLCSRSLRLRWRAADTKLCLTRVAGQKLGLQVNIMLETGVMRVSEVSEGGLVAAWNAQQPRQARIRHGDWIVSVNGESKSASGMFRALERDSSVELVISRQRPPQNTEPAGRLRHTQGNTHTSDGVPEEGSVRIPVSLHGADQEPLGMDVLFAKGCGLVQKVSGEGAVPRWNAEHPDKEVRMGDQIVFVNGTSRCDMLPRLWQAGTLHMVVRRGPAVDNTAEVLPRSFIETLPKASLDEEERSCCGFCLEDCVADSFVDVRRLPCRHVFHKDCLEPWLTQHSTNCPLCAWAADHPMGGLHGYGFGKDTEEAYCEGWEIDEEPIVVTPHMTMLRSAGRPRQD